MVHQALLGALIQNNLVALLCSCLQQEVASYLKIQILLFVKTEKYCEAGNKQLHVPVGSVKILSSFTLFVI